MTRVPLHLSIEIIDERSVATDLLKGGWVLDVGARGYVFAKEMARRGERVIALDPAPSNERINNVIMVDAGLVGIGHAGAQPYADWDNGEGSCLVNFGGTVPDRATVRNVQTIDIAKIMTNTKIPHWDCVKMNCEGAEFDILSTWPGPIANQITVSFHDHTGANRGGEATYAKILAHLSQWYNVVRHVKEPRYGAGESYWDSLFVLRGAT